MKNFIFLLLLISFSSICFAQEFQRSLSDFDFKQSGRTVDSKFIIKAIEKYDGFMEVTITDGIEDLQSFSAKPFTYPLFSAKLSNAFKKINGLSSINNSQDSMMSLFISLTSYFNAVNERPQVATVHRKDDIPIFLDIVKKNDSLASWWQFWQSNSNEYRGEALLEDATVDITFYNGFIEKIEVKGKVDDVEFVFANKYSIGVSSLSNIIKFKDIYLYSLDEYEVGIPADLDSISSIEEKPVYITEEIKYRKFKVRLSDVIKYERKLDVNANDISPVKTLVNLDNEQKTVKVYREESTKLFEIHTYTDLAGALVEDNPNGIVQLELKKKFKLSTSRSDSYWRSLFLAPVFGLRNWIQGERKQVGYGNFEYVETEFHLSKLEENNKFIFGDQTDLSNLDFFQRRNISVGLNLNLIAIEEQDLKYNLFFDSGIHFNTVGFKTDEQSTAPIYLNGLEWATSGKIHIFPEKRYGLVASSRLSYYEIFDKENISSITDRTQWLNTFGIEAYVDIAAAAKIFIRYQLVSDFEDITQNFSRFQIGTSFYVLQKVREDKN